MDNRFLPGQRLLTDTFIVMQIDDAPLDAKKISINLRWGWGSLLVEIARTPDISVTTHEITTI